MTRFLSLCRSSLAALMLGLALTPAAWAQLPQAPELAAKHYLLLDMTTNQVLSERAADSPADPASLTKLMTAYVVFAAIREKKLSLEQALPVSRRAWEERKGGGSLMFIDTTMTPKVDELLRGMIVQSGNDASVALAEGVAGTVDQFVAMMNRQAQAFGLKNTSFKNVTGLTEAGHKSTARELAVIASRIIKRLSRVLPLLRDQGLQVQQHHPAQPQPAAAPRPQRRRHEDRLHRGCRLLPDRQRAARVSQPRCHR